MRIVLACILLAGAVGSLAGQQPATGLACVTDMPIPGYRGAVWLTSITGEATAAITVGPSGAAAEVDVQSTQPLLVGLLKPPLSSAAFLTGCAGQTVEIKFSYRLNGDPAPEPHNEIRLKAGNTFVITARPPIPQKPIVD